MWCINVTQIDQVLYTVYCIVLLLLHIEITLSKRNVLCVVECKTTAQLRQIVLDMQNADFISYLPFRVASLYDSTYETVLL